MTVIKYKNTSVKLNTNETVLDGLLRNGYDISCGCKAGVCQSCLVSVGQTKDSLNCAQKGMSDTQKKLGYVLSCQFKPKMNTVIASVGATGKQVDALVIDKKYLNERVIRLRLKVPFNFISAQYLTLYKNEKIARSYSIVSHSKYHDYVELHICILKEGVFSQWIKNDVWVGHTIGVQGPMGDCIYKKQDKPILLIAMHMGIAPIYGILQDALINGHKQKIDIVYAAKHYKDLYFLDELNELCKKYSNIKLHVITQLNSGEGSQKTNIYQYIKTTFTKLDKYHVYLCGDDTHVDAMSEILIGNGLSFLNISSERFLSF